MNRKLEKKIVKIRRMHNSAPQIQELTKLLLDLDKRLRYIEEILEGFGYEV